MSKTRSDIFTAAKNLPLVPGWEADESGKLSFCAPLDLEWVTYEGLFLRASAMQVLPERDVTFQLEHRPAGERDGQLARMDWRPVHEHNNKGRGPPEYRFKVQLDTHYHRFDLNYSAASDSMLQSNLPIATPVEQIINDYNSLLDYMADAFNIRNLRELPPPPWRRVLV